MITIFGLGFVGLTTALGFATYGYKVYGIDVSQSRKDVLREGKLPFLEKGLDVALEKNLGRNFVVTDNVRFALENSEIIFYCVGTPYGDNGEANLTYLFNAIDETLLNISKDKKYYLVIKSTVPPATTAERVLPYIESKGLVVGKDIFLANNPEFLREGRCWEDFINADRIVVGCNDSVTTERLNMLYKPFGIPFFSTSLNTSEYIKYLSNTLLATMISYSNEMANIADAIGDINIKEAFQILHKDKRWNHCDMTTYVYPGCGYGGYCLPKDTNALYAMTRRIGVGAKILENVIETNNGMPDVIAKKITSKITPNDHVGILGLSFKPGSDDVRDSISAKVISELLEDGVKHIYAYDPVAIREFKRNYTFDIEYIEDLTSLQRKSDVLVILTAWDEFRKVKAHSLKPVLDFRYL